MKVFRTDLSQNVLNVQNLSLAGYLSRIGYPYGWGDWCGGKVTHRVMIQSEGCLMYLDTCSKMPLRQIPTGQGRLVVWCWGVLRQILRATVNEDDQDDEADLVNEQ